MRSDPVVPQSLSFEEGRESPGQLPGVSVEPAVGGLANERAQCGVLGGQPGQRLSQVGRLGNGDPRLRRRHPDGVAVRGEQVGGGVCGVQVRVQHSMQRAAQVGAVVEPVRLLLGVGA